MSLIRLVIWSCLIGGWSAFASWFLTEILFHAWIDQDSKLAITLSIAMATLVATAIGGGVSFASGLTNPNFNNLIKRLLLGFAGGILGGLFASLLGACVFWMFERVTFLGFLSRLFGWTLTGVAVGLIEGIIDRDMKKIRNGLIGGGVGGFLAGILFVPISFFLSPMSSRAFAFVLLGLFIGLFIGLAQVILKQAWLTVEAGFRAGRQLILGQDVITMGTSEKSSLIFIAYGAKGVEPVHLKITKQPNGGYLLEDNQSRTGTMINGKPVTAPTSLVDGDTIQFGVNVVRFNEQVKHGHAAQNLPDAKPSIPTPAVPAGAIQANPPAAKPATASAIQPAIPAPSPAVQATKPAPAPVAPSPAAAAKPEQGSCPICGKKIVGIPGNRRCGDCFTTF